jgi:hypothetical protein
MLSVVLWDELLKLTIKVQVLNEDLVSMCMPYGDANPARPTTPIAGASARCVKVLRNLVLLHFVVRNVLTSTGWQKLMRHFEAFRKMQEKKQPGSCLNQCDDAMRSIRSS